VTLVGQVDGACERHDLCSREREDMGSYPWRKVLMPVSTEHGNPRWPSLTEHGLAVRKEMWVLLPGELQPDHLSQCVDPLIRTGPLVRSDTVAAM
jgi:hypothetical protein